MALAETASPLIASMRRFEIATTASDEMLDAGIWESHQLKRAGRTPPVHDLVIGTSPEHALSIRRVWRADCWRIVWTRETGRMKLIATAVAVAMIGATAALAQENVIGQRQQLMKDAGPQRGRVPPSPRARRRSSSRRRDRC
ncbi:hypothetical protein [Chelatococcus sp. CO-6]|uniref:hypothetical protein n=1 Tax=Chelatococcus sp. CO-6 TaxID=1702325 RepID=UPI00069F9C8A|nr:hypothetical protein [Chelatococcus sp. CO-6]